MPTAQASRDGHSIFSCSRCGAKNLGKSEVFIKGRKYVCGDCR